METTNNKLVLIGTIVHIADATQGETWIKQNFLIRTNDQFPQLVEFMTFNTAQDMLSRCKINDVVAVHFNCKSREYQGKYYTELTAYRVYVIFEKKGGDK
jgi:hypothetical protein